MTNGNTRSLLIKESGMDRPAAISPPGYIVDDDDDVPSPNDQSSSEDSVEAHHLNLHSTSSSGSSSSSSDPHDQRHLSRHTADRPSRRIAGSTAFLIPTQTVASSTDRRLHHHRHIKRRHSSPIKAPKLSVCAPLKKRKIVVNSNNNCKVDLTVDKCDDTESKTMVPAPFRPWNIEATPRVPDKDATTAPEVPTPLTSMFGNAGVVVGPLGYIVPLQTAHAQQPQPPARKPHAYFRPPSPPGQPLELVKKPALPSATQSQAPPVVVKVEKPKHCAVDASPRLALGGVELRVPAHPAVTGAVGDVIKALAPVISDTGSTTPTPNLLLVDHDDMLDDDDDAASSSLVAPSRKEQRNYKNMTRERRIEANARERTRVHTISAAFETLRKSVPAYSHSQKLSKLSVLRIACGYIATLSSMLDGDDEATAENVASVTRTIQREGKFRKKNGEED